jgi:proteic killer suppression protein
MIESFADKGSKDIFDGENSTAARGALPNELLKRARRKLDQLDVAKDLNDLAVPPGNNLEALKGALKGKHSIRINDQYRIVFRFEGGNANDVEVSKHYQ